LASASRAVVMVCERLLVILDKCNVKCIRNVIHLKVSQTKVNGNRLLHVLALLDDYVNPVDECLLVLPTIRVVKPNRILNFTR
jgi:hypothetical protein